MESERINEIIYQSNCRARTGCTVAAVRQVWRTRISKKETSTLRCLSVFLVRWCVCICTEVPACVLLQADNVYTRPKCYKQECFVGYLTNFPSPHVLFISNTTTYQFVAPILLSPNYWPTNAYRTSTNIGWYDSIATESNATNNLLLCCTDCICTDYIFSGWMGRMLDELVFQYHVKSWGSQQYYCCQTAVLCALRLLIWPAQQYRRLTPTKRSQQFLPLWGPIIFGLLGRVLVSRSLALYRDGKVLDVGYSSSIIRCSCLLFVGVRTQHPTSSCG